MRQSAQLSAVSGQLRRLLAGYRGLDRVRGMVRGLVRGLDLEISGTNPICGSVGEVGGIRVDFWKVLIMGEIEAEDLCDWVSGVFLVQSPSCR